MGTSIRLTPLALSSDANAHDSLGEGYMAARRNAEAIASYRKSLALDPANANAGAMLKKLGADGVK